MKNVVAFLMIFSMVLGLSMVARAQVEGQGWKLRTYTERLEPEIHDHLYSMTPPPSSFYNESCFYTRTEDDTLQTFKLLGSRSNRVEICLDNDYTSGKHQFQGELRIVPPLTNECVMQIFGNTGGKTLFMLQGFPENGGSLKYYGRTTLASHIYMRWVTVNIVHTKGECVHAYIDKQLVGSWEESIDHPNSFKYGVYGTMRTGSAQVEWRNVKIFTKP